MNKHFFLFVTLFCAFNGLHVYAENQPTFARIKQEQVALYQAKVAKEIRRNKCVQVGLAATLLGSIGYGGYKVFFGAAPQPAVESLAPIVAAGEPVSNEALKVALDKAAETIKLQEKMLIDAGALTDKSTWGTWLKSWGRFFGQQYTLVFLSQIATDTLNPFTKYFKRLDGAVDGAIAKVFHDGDLNWFVSTHTNIFDLFDQLESNKDGDVARLFASTWQLSVQQISSIVGFMQHKFAQLEKHSVDNAQRAHSIVDNIVKMTNETSDQLTVLIQKREDVTALAQRVVLVQQLRTQLQQALSEFAFVEAVTVY